MHATKCYLAPENVLALMFHLDNINRVEIYTRIIISDESVAQKTSTTLLQLVGKNGRPFQTNDLNQMSLRPDELTTLYNLCERRHDQLAAYYFPDERSETVKLGLQKCVLDKFGTVHVHFTLTLA